MCLRCDCSLLGIACGGLTRGATLFILKLFLILIYIEYVFGIIAIIINANNRNYSAISSNTSGLIQTVMSHMSLLVIAHIYSIVEPEPYELATQNAATDA